MSNSGYVYAYRKAWTHDVFNDLLEAAIWNFLYQNAFWKDGIRNFNGYTFYVKRGQIVTSVSFLAKGFRVSEKGVRTVIQKLEKHGMIGVQGASRGTIITICNYEEYQGSQNAEGEQIGNRGANEGRAGGDNKKEVNKDNKTNKEIIKPDGVSDQVWTDFLTHRKAKKAKVTETVIRKFTEQAKLAGVTLEYAFETCCARGWTGFEASWLSRNNEEAKMAERIAADKKQREKSELLSKLMGNSNG